MKIGMIAPTVYKIPPKKYGGIEQLLYDLSSEYHERGLDVTLFAPLNSHSKCRIVETVRTGESEEIAYKTFIKRTLDRFDLIQDHSHERHLLLDNQELVNKSIFFLHGLQINLLCPPKAPCLVAESEYHADVESYKFGKTVLWCYIGIDLDRYKPRKDKDDFFLHLGLMAPHKGAHISAYVTSELGEKLIIAGEDRNVPRPDYVRELHRVLTKVDNVEYLGPVTHEQKIDLLGRAKAVLLPNLRSEAFSLIGIEALASGTPVITFNKGVFPELIKNGRTGFCAKDYKEFKQAFKKVEEIDYNECIKESLRFSIKKVADNTLWLSRLASEGNWEDRW